MGTFEGVNDEYLKLKRDRSMIANDEEGELRNFFHLFENYTYEMQKELKKLDIESSIKSDDDEIILTVRGTKGIVYKLDYINQGISVNYDTVNLDDNSYLYSPNDLKHKTVKNHRGTIIEIEGAVREDYKLLLKSLL